MVMKACETCGRIFNATANHKTCGPNCSEQRKRKRRIRPTKYRECVICGETFPLRLNDTTITCGKDCSRTRERQRHNAKQRKRRGTVAVIECVVCGDPITVKGTTKTCVSECRLELRRRTNGRYRRNKVKANEAQARRMKDPEYRARVNRQKEESRRRRANTPERRAARREQERLRRGKLTAAEKKRRAIRDKKSARERRNRSPESVEEYRRKKQDEMRLRMADPVKAARVRYLKRKARQRRHQEESISSVTNAVSLLSKLIKKEI